jgi:hypothetical protein
MSIAESASSVIATARATATWTEDTYVLHFERCTAKDYAHCQRCEDLLMDAIAAEKHLARLEREL